MAVTAIDIVQDNTVGDSDLIAVHNPVVFKINVTYTGSAPDIVYARVFDSTPTLLGTFKCVPYVDVTTNIRQYIFIADSILRGYMEDEFEDFVQTGASLDYCDGITKEFRIDFDDYDTPLPAVPVYFTAIHAARQFGDENGPNAEDIFNNDAKVYYACEEKPVYLYVYNDDEANIIGTTSSIGDDYIACDYDDEDFEDSYDGELFTIYAE